ncbi:MAG TPA: c-type cytochrome, partial [Chthoniobacteraceae bacterium]|nr:c-type cytochrome [Chthoniobacteraceae bacterium]
PQIIDEPSVYDYAPQHESTCGFRFNGPAPGRGRFGPEFWAGDAIVTGESRGKLWRTKLVKTAAGYVARTELIARMSLLAVDCAISPKGDLVVCCHTGKPDWGNGPQGEGRIFKISYTDPNAPQPVVTFARNDMRSVISFDRDLNPTDLARLAHAKVETGRYVEAADRLESIRPGYAVVKMQQRQARAPLDIVSVPTAGNDSAAKQIPQTESAFSIYAKPHRAAVNYAFAFDGLDVMHDLSGVAAFWGTDHRILQTKPAGPHRTDPPGWLPHPDFTVARALTAGSRMHDPLWQDIQRIGELTLRGQLDLWQMLTPATQPLSNLDYEADAEDATVVFKSDAPLKLQAAGVKLEVISEHEVRLTQRATRKNNWFRYTLTVATPVTTLDVSFFTSRDLRPRALPCRRFLMDFAEPAPPDDLTRTIPEIAGGNYEAGHALFKGKAACATCHQLRGDGFRVGPELSNLMHRDYASVLRDIAEPNALINPDAIGYTVTMKDASTVVGTRLAETEAELQIAQVGGAVAKLSKKEIAKVEPMTVSLMPAGLDKALTAEELRDLMTYLLSEEPKAAAPKAKPN